MEDLRSFGSSTQSPELAAVAEATTHSFLSLFAVLWQRNNTLSWSRALADVWLIATLRSALVVVMNFRSVAGLSQMRSEEVG